jgi:hypothetical protein
MLNVAFGMHPDFATITKFFISCNDAGLESNRLEKTSDAKEVATKLEKCK